MTSTSIAVTARYVTSNATSGLMSSCLYRTHQICLVSEILVPKVTGCDALRSCPDYGMLVVAGDSRPQAVGI